MFGDFFFFKQKTAYEMRISDWSSDVCSSDLHRAVRICADDGVLELLLARQASLGGDRELELLVRVQRRCADAPDGGLDVLGPDRCGDQIGRASCRESVCQYV